MGYWGQEAWKACDWKPAAPGLWVPAPMGEAGSISAVESLPTTQVPSLELSWEVLLGQNLLADELRSVHTSTWAKVIQPGACPGDLFSVEVQKWHWFSQLAWQQPLFLTPPGSGRSSSNLPVLQEVKLTHRAGRLLCYHGSLSWAFSEAKMKRDSEIWEVRNQSVDFFLALGGVKQWMSGFTLSGPSTSLEKKKKDLYWADLFIRKVWNFCWCWPDLCSWSVALGCRGACIFPASFLCRW